MSWRENQKSTSQVPRALTPASEKNNPHKTYTQFQNLTQKNDSKPASPQPATKINPP